MLINIWAEDDGESNLKGNETPSYAHQGNHWESILPVFLCCVQLCLNRCMELSTSWLLSAGRPTSQQPQPASTSSGMVERLRNLVLNFELPSPSRLDIATCNTNCLTLSTDGLVAR